MQAVTYDHFGGPEVLTLGEVAAPAVRAGHLRVRVAAVSINPLDAKIRRGQLTLLSGRRFPKTPGLDLAGTVDAVGAGVTGFAVGDRVFGFTGSMRTGTLSDLATVPAAAVARIPASIDATGAASIAVVGLAALQALRDAARVKAGDRVLLNGATGGIGPYAVQLARRMGAHVTAVGSGDGLALLRDLGADAVVDYRRDSILAAGQRFDAVIDLSTHLPFAAARPILTARGVHVAVEPSPPALIAAALANRVRRQQRRFLMTKPSGADLADLGRLLDGGELRLGPVQAFERRDWRQAFELAERGGVVGKVVIRLQ
jgi:NADPH:quinone reductase-like Zn-dependent oxidoreductase